ncbi:hypothetical protein [Limnoglobus roseus]|uniref:Transglutaminase-like domain-containing protein n=1 Tax=Limnoglobus roseus TaxID=2598579 RepID=A0A5C1AFR8_9BACT|nr:hypothetical protein [Limnoglobus roseus]QEL16582.1 hypothetical protein PX52LOC_03542 [Limnoglobus roseus]
MRRSFLLLTLVLAGCSSKPQPAATRTDGKSPAQTLDPWPTAATTLRKQPDIAGMRQAVAQLTSDLANNPNAEQLPTLPPDAIQSLGEQLRLTPNEVKEVSSTTFTNLDASYVAECLILRDAVRSLDLGNHTAERRAMFGFDWVCRQVYLRYGGTLTPNGFILTQPLPPQYVLLRGYGTGLERAYTFLAVLQQLGLPGCLIGPPGREQAASQVVANGQPTKGPFWAVGAQLPDGQIALFDPWRGQPFPGPNGSIGTLAQVLANPDQLKPWRDDKNTPWDVPVDDVKAATVYAAFSFSSTTPRMKVMEQKTAADVGVNLYRNVAETLKNFGPAAKLWAPAGRQDLFCYTRVQETFLPVEDGGIDSSPKDQRLFDLVTKYHQVPTELFRPPADLTIPEVRERLQGGFFGHLQAWIFANNPREKLDRGQFNELIRAMVDLEQKLNAARDRNRATALPGNAVAGWQAQATKVYQQLSQARLPQNQADLPAAEQAVTEFWSKSGPVLQHFEDTLIVPVAAAETAYFLAACKHEQAERVSIRMHRTPPGDPARAAAEKAAKDAWAVAKDAWARHFTVAEPYLNAHPERTAHLRGLADRAARLAVNPTSGW